MKRRLLVALLALFACEGLCENYASAQTWQLGQYGPPTVRTRSAVSPYVTLGQGGGAYDYYGVVRPQVDASHSIGQLQYGLNQLTTADGLLNPNAVLPQNPANALGGMQTGHAATYFNYGHYFPATPNGTVSNIPGAGGYGANYGAGQAGYGNQQQVRPFYSGTLNSFR
jgi:hypothetical protein